MGEMKLKQRPSIDETISRGILLHRTDTKLNYDLQARHKQLHKRKASQNLEKLMFKRPTPSQLEKKGILIKNKQDLEKKNTHKRQASQDLEAGLKRRMSLSQMQGLGLLFMDHGYEFDLAPQSDSDDDGGNNEHFMDENERNANIAGLFKQKPRTSKPLQETDFKGIEFNSSHSTSNNKRRDSNEIKIQQFEPSLLSKKERISRIGAKLGQRPSVEEMKMRGLL